MTGNVPAVRSVPGRSQGDNLCRRCHREFETLAHVLGACTYGELLRNSRHHAARSAIANAPREQGYEAYEEVHDVAQDGSHRYHCFQTWLFTRLHNRSYHQIRVSRKST